VTTETFQTDEGREPITASAHSVGYYALAVVSAILALFVVIAVGLLWAWIMDNNITAAFFISMIAPLIFIGYLIFKPHPEDAEETTEESDI